MRQDRQLIVRAVDVENTGDGFSQAPEGEDHDNLLQGKEKTQLAVFAFCDDPSEIKKNTKLGQPGHHLKTGISTRSENEPNDICLRLFQ